MKKTASIFLSFAAIVLMLCACLVINTGAVDANTNEDGGLEINFNSESDTNYFNSPTDTNVDYDSEENAIKFTVRKDSQDPNINFTVSRLARYTEEGAFGCEDYKYIIIRAKTPDTDISASFKIYFTTSTNPISEGFTSSFSLTSDNEWHYYMVDMSQNSQWTGNLTDMRLDYKTTASKGESVLISQMMFYKDEIAAYEKIISLTLGNSEESGSEDESMSESLPAESQSTAENMSAQESSTSENQNESGCNSSASISAAVLSALAGLSFVKGKKFRIPVLLAVLCLSMLLIAGCDDRNDTDTTSGEQESVTEKTDENTSENNSESQSEENTSEEETTDYFEYTEIETVTPDPSKHVDISITGEGYDIYRVPQGTSGYRYGCSMIRHDDNSLDAYFASVGADGEWDWITYKHSDDNGVTWTNEKVVLTPTDKSMDFYSVCDPGVVYFNGYYYLGYTSTISNDQVCNNVYVARSENPDGPFEKWNGEGWGGNPEPIFYYDQDCASWGMGEPSFVELNGTLYIYYTNTTPTGGYTMVATADATDENWPATIVEHGVAIQKGSVDSLDVKYVEDYGKFLAIATGNRMTADSYVVFYESDDGITFTQCDPVKENTYAFCHNAGISGTPNGHIKLSDQTFIIYAYGTDWGQWNTRVQPISITLSDKTTTQIIEEGLSKDNINEEYERDPIYSESELWPVCIKSNPDVYEFAVDHGKFVAKIYWYDVYRSSHQIIDPTGLVLSGYDENIVTFNGYIGEIKGIGETTVTVEYNGCKTTFKVVVTEEGITGTGENIVSFTPVSENYTIDMSGQMTYRPQIRAKIVFDNGEFDELFVEASQKDGSFPVTYTGYDESVISVNEYGVVTAKKAGSTKVTVTLGEFSFEVSVTVK